MQKLNLEVRLGYPTDSRRPGDRIASLEITDKDSCLRVLEIELDEKMLYDLMANRIAHATGLFNSQHTARFGKELLVETIPLGQVDEAGLEAAITRAALDGWESFEARKRGGSTSLVVRRWVAQ